MSQENNFIPEQESYKKITPFRLFVKSNFPFIEATYEALDNYGLYCKVVEYLNNVIENENTVESNVQALYDAFVSLNTYVSDYFDNLDVQNEINNKLDNMVISGEFQTILGNVANNLLASKVDKDGVGQITTQNLSQGVRELITGGSTAVVGFETVGSYNMQPNTIDYADLSDNMKKNNACLPNYSRKYLLFEQGRRDTTDDGSLGTATTCVTSTTSFKFGHAKYAIKVKSGFSCYFTGRYNGTKITAAGWGGGFNDLSNNLIGLQVQTNGYEDIYEFYLEIRKTDQSNITPTEAIDAYELYEYNEPDIVKIDYNSLSNDLQKFLYEDETVVHPYGDILVGSTIRQGYIDFIFNNTPFNNQANNRGWVTTPLYLPAGTQIVTTDGWKFVIMTKASRYETTKVYYPSTYTTSHTVATSDNYYILIARDDNNNFWDIRDQFAEHCTITFPSKRALSKETFYVSPTGNDTTGDGSSGNPYRQITKAISEGARTIYVKAGTYNPVTIQGDDTHIYGEIETYNVSTNPIQKYATISNGIEIENISASGGLLTAAYTADTDSSMYKCLVAKTKDLHDSNSERSYGYYATIYSKGDKDTSHRYIPTLSDTEVASTAGTFYYDGTDIIIHPYNDNDESFEYYLVDSDSITNNNLCAINGANNIVLENIKFEYSDGDLLKLTNSSDVKVDNCIFVGSSLNNNVALLDSNADISNSISYLARNDGYNFHGFGDTSVINCVGCNCFDDGISHHDKCNSVISGGEYYGNNKGGVSTPTYGAKSTIESVYTHDNGYGIYCVTDVSHGTSTIYLSNCLITDNNVGMNISQAEGCIYNNVLHGNTTNTSGTNDCVSYNNTIVS